MSILEDFLANDLQHLPNDTQNTPCGVLPHGARPDTMPHHKHHHTARIAAHSAMHGQQNPPSVPPNDQESAQNAPIASHDVCASASATNRLPCRQKNADDFLMGNTPGVMAFYAPEEQRNAKQHPSPQPANINANTRPDNATIEDAETVHRLVSWREEASY